MSTSSVQVMELGLDELPLERLEVEITSLAGRLAAATCQWLLAVAAYDRREGWSGWGCRSMAHWLSWQCGLSAPAAREHVRTARALVDLPVVRAEMSAGRLSYSQVRAITRVATPATEVELVGAARVCTATQLDRMVAAYRGCRERQDDTAQRPHVRRGLQTWVDDDGMQVITVRLCPEDAQAVLAAVDGEAERCWRERRSAADVPGNVNVEAEEGDHRPGRLADALVTLVERGAASADTAASVRDGAVTVIHVDAEVLAGGAAGPGAAGAGGACHVQGGPGLAAETARRLSCQGTVAMMADRPDGTSIDVGRRSRLPTAALRRSLELRDQGRCVFPGCEATLGSDAHHVRHWSQGGPTDLDNLALLCRFHHRRVHEGGYHMRPAPRPSVGGRLDPSARWVFTTPDGRTIPAVVDPPSERPGTDLPAVAPDACIPDWDGTRLGTYALGVMVEGLLTLDAHHAGAPAGAPPA